jgi:hypothetical protein
VKGSLGDSGSLAFELEFYHDNDFQIKTFIAMEFIHFKNFLLPGDCSLFSMEFIESHRSKFL